jgi:DNA repair protein SbcC/Rad50
MKIVELRFKNINSLYGEWCIDFRDPVFAADGLFAITGPTGSGKTTILDALCLALYGQTPRLGKMTASENEVMSRQTGECFAEVLFESGRGLFRATWHQHRSRNRAGEKLQAPKRELSNEQGELLAEKLKDVQEMVDEITGMGFDRFTRSILLAQGSFDAFLKANADDRSPLLEQITGTGIYSDISCAVHRRNSEENQRLSELKASLGGIQLLTGEELEQLERERKEVDERYVVEAQRRDAAQASLDHSKRLQALEQAVAETRLEQARCEEAWQAFEPEAQKLADARRAGPLEVEQVTLVNLRNRLQRIGQEKSQSEAALPPLVQQLAIAREKGARAEAMLKEKAAEQQTMAPLLRQVREVDTQWGERSEMLKKAVTSHQEQCKELEALQKREIGTREQLKRQQESLIEADAYQRDHAQDAELVAQLTALLQRLDHVNGLEAEEQKSRDAVEVGDVAGAHSCAEG